MLTKKLINVVLEGNNKFKYLGYPKLFHVEFGISTSISTVDHIPTVITGTLNNNF